MPMRCIAAAIAVTACRTAAAPLTRDQLVGAGSASSLRAGSVSGYGRLASELVPAFRTLDVITADIVTGPEFRVALDWIPAVDAGPGGPRVPGSVLARMYFGEAAGYAPRPACYAYDCMSGNTTATTDLTDSGCGSATGNFAVTTLHQVVLDRTRQRPEGLACAINTVAHEWTHSIADAHSRMIFLDTGYRDVSFGLASYTVGAVAQCVYLRRWRPQLDLRACLEAVGTHAFHDCTCAAGWLDAFIAGETSCR